MTYRQVLMFRWSLVTAGLIALFWTIWYLVAKSVPIVAEISVTKDLSYQLPFYISRWWDILLGPAYSCIFVYLFSIHEKIRKGEDLDFKLYLGLGFGLFLGLVFGLVFGLGSHGLVFGLGLGLFFVLMFLVFDLFSGLGFGLGFGLVFGLVSGLGAGLIFGLVLGLISGLLKLIFRSRFKDWILAKGKEE